MAVGSTRIDDRARRLAWARRRRRGDGVGMCARRSATRYRQGRPSPISTSFERGTEALNEKKWLTAREFFKSVTETYTQSPYRPDAKLGVGDTYLGEGTPEALVLALNEFQEFLAFYPTHPRADYAQYKVGMTHHRQMRSAGRDQTETRAAVTSFEAFLDALSEQQAAAGRRGAFARGERSVGEHEFGVGRYYYSIRWYPGAIDALEGAARAGSRVLRTRRGVLLPRRIADEAGQRAGGVAVLRAARRRVRAERAPAGSPRSDRAAEDHRRANTGKPTPNRGASPLGLPHIRRSPALASIRLATSCSDLAGLAPIPRDGDIGDRRLSKRL